MRCSELYAAPLFPHLPVAFRNGSLLLPLKEREKTSAVKRIPFDRPPR
jgi:hypothetical protein